MIWEPGSLSLVSPPQMRSQSQGPTGNICQCPLHNTGFYGKIEPSSTGRGNSRASLLTDMSWKLASYFGRDPRFLFFFWLLPHHPLKDKKNKKRGRRKSLWSRGSWNPGSPTGASLSTLLRIFVGSQAGACRKKCCLWHRKLPIRETSRIARLALWCLIYDNSVAFSVEFNSY